MMKAAVQELPIINFLARFKHSVQIQFYPCSGRTFSLGTWLFSLRILLLQYLEVSMERGNCYISPHIARKLLHFTLILLPREKILWRQDYRDWRTNHVWAGGERERTRRAWEIMNSEVGGLQGKLWILKGFKGSFQGLVMHGGVKRGDKLCLHLVCWFRLNLLV